MKAWIFTLERQTLPVTIDKQSYVIQELDGRQRDKYISDLGGRVKRDKDGKQTGAINLDGMQANLVAMSLKKVVDGVLTDVNVDTIQSWPAKVSSAIFDACQELSGLNEKNEEKAEGKG